VEPPRRSHPGVQVGVKFNEGELSKKMYYYQYLGDGILFYLFSRGY